MASEASKIRNQCAKKYGVREKAYKETIARLQAELATANDKLKDYDEMKRVYMKMLIYCGLNEKDRERVLHSQEIEEAVDRYAGFLGIAGSQALREVANQVFAQNGAVSLVDIMNKVINQR